MSREVGFFCKEIMKYEVWPDVEVSGGRGRFGRQLVVLVDTLRSTGLQYHVRFYSVPLAG